MFISKSTDLSFVRNLTGGPGLPRCVLGGFDSVIRPLAKGLGRIIRSIVAESTIVTSFGSEYLTEHMSRSDYIQY